MVNRIETRFTAVNGEKDYVILAGKNPVYPFVDGKMTSDMPDRFSFSVCCQGNRFTPLNIKIEGSSDNI